MRSNVESGRENVFATKNDDVDEIVAEREWEGKILNAKPVIDIFYCNKMQIIKTSASEQHPLYSKYRYGSF